MDQIRHPRRTAQDQIIAAVLWCVRGMRCSHAEMTGEAVYEYQRYRFSYSLEQVQQALGVLKHRGFQWDVYYAEIPDACVVIRQSA